MGKIFPSHSRGDLSSLFRDRRTRGLSSARLFDPNGDFNRHDHVFVSVVHEVAVKTKPPISGFVKAIVRVGNFLTTNFLRIEAKKDDKPRGCPQSERRLSDIVFTSL